MKGKSFTFWERLYYRFFKGVRIVDIGGSYKSLGKDSDGKDVAYSSGQPLSFKVKNEVAKTD